MIEIKATPIAQQKYDNIFNGSKSDIDKFLKDIQTNGINKNNFEFLFERSGESFYYKKCKKIYILFWIKNNDIIILDFLTEDEFNNFKNKS